MTQASWEASSLGQLREGRRANAKCSPKNPKQIYQLSLLSLLSFHNGACDTSYINLKSQG